MRRIESTYSEDDLILLLQENQLGRNEDIESILGILSTIEGGFSLFLDSEWGSGKTVFVKQLKLVLESMNPSLVGDESLWTENFPDALSDGAPLSFLPIYYNAWENDYWSDPLPSLLGTIASQFELSLCTKVEPETSAKVAAFVDAALSVFHLSGAAKLQEAFSGIDLIEAYKNRDKLRDKVSELIETLLLERANTALLIIDELDRCKPSFALSLLEEVKALFDSENLIVLYATNCKQLRYTIEGAYGLGFDGERYLSRFYDMKVALRKIPGIEYLSYLGFSKTSSYFDKISAEIPDVYNMELRDCNTFYTEMKRVRPLVTGNHQNDFISSFIYVGIVPIMLALKIVDTEKFNSITEHNDYGQLLKEILRLPTAAKFLDRAINAAYQNLASDNLSQSELDARKDKFIKSITFVLWHPDEHSDEYRSAYSELSPSCWTIDGLRDINSIFETGGA